MRKTILMGLGLALSLAGTAAAQQAGRDAPRRPKAEGERGPGGRFDGRGGAPDGFLLRGITLTDAQKATLKELRKWEHDKMDANRDAMSKQRDAVRAVRERGDTLAVRAIVQRRHQEMMQARDQHVVAVRNVLTAEQRTQFDKNVAEAKQRGERGPRGEKPGRFGR